MWSLPPIPAWENLHPIAVHFPIALIMVVPVFIVLAGLWKGHGRTMLLSATVLAALGAASAFLATVTGDAAEENVEMSIAAKQVFEQHEDLAMMARNLAAGLAVILAVATAVAWLQVQEIRTGVRRIGTGVLLAFTAVPMVVMASAAHQGGRLVHEFGVCAISTQSVTQATSPELAGPNHVDD